MSVGKKIDSLLEEANALNRHIKAKQMGIDTTGNWQAKVKKQIKDDSMTAFKDLPRTEPKVKTRYDNISQARDSFGSRVSPNREIGGINIFSNEASGSMPTAIGSYNTVSMPMNKDTNTFHTHPGQEMTSMFPSSADKLVLQNKTKQLGQPVVDTVASLREPFGATTYSNTLKKDPVTGDYNFNPKSVTYTPTALQTSQPTPNQQEWSSEISKAYNNKLRNDRDNGAFLNGRFPNTRENAISLGIKPDQKHKDFYLG